MEANMLTVVMLQEAVPNTDLRWLFLLFMAFFFSMVLVGWWYSRRNGMLADRPVEVHAHHPENSGPVEETPVAADDLVMLEGIVPKVAEVLGDAGITTFEALANANPADIQKTLNAAGLQMMDPASWIEQARLAAAGDWTGLEKLQAELKGGRRS